jgi:DNA-binding NarL/FixJ family response regulator
MARVLLFTDEPVLARGFTSVLSSVPGFDSVSVCQSTAELAVTIQTSKPDVLLIDLTPDVTFGILTQLQGSLPNCRIVLWVRAISTELAYQAMELGVRGVLRKTLPPELLIKCLGKVAEGELWFDKTLTASFLSAKMIALTKRESQLVSLLSQGLKNKEIATTLSISEGTVKVYLSRLFQKVGVKDRFELALYGLRNLQNMSGEPSALNPLPQHTMLGGARDPGQMQWLRSLVLEKPSDKGIDNLPVWSPRS